VEVGLGGLAYGLLLTKLAAGAWYSQHHPTMGLSRGLRLHCKVLQVLLCHSLCLHDLVLVQLPTTGEPLILEKFVFLRQLGVPVLGSPASLECLSELLLHLFLVVDFIMTLFHLFSSIAIFKISEFSPQVVILSQKKLVIRYQLLLIRFQLQRFGVSEASLLNYVRQALDFDIFELKITLALLHFLLCVEGLKDQLLLFSINFIYFFVEHHDFVVKGYSLLLCFSPASILLLTCFFDPVELIQWNCFILELSLQGFKCFLLVHVLLSRIFQISDEFGHFFLGLSQLSAALCKLSLQIGF
jgi:hypothetical protein